MTRLETIEEEIAKLSPEELAELRRWLESAVSRPEPQPAPTKKYTSEDIHRMLFPNGPPERRTIEELRQDLEESINDARG